MIVLAGVPRKAVCWCVCQFNHPDRRNICGPVTTVALRRVGVTETLLCARCGAAAGALLIDRKNEGDRHEPPPA